VTYTRGLIICSTEVHMVALPNTSSLRCQRSIAVSHRSNGRGVRQSHPWEITFNLPVRLQGNATRWARLACSSGLQIHYVLVARASTLKACCVQDCVY